MMACDGLPMRKVSDVKHFGYRLPRYNFPGKVRVEIKRAGSARMIPATGIDISADGIAVAVSESISLGTPVLLAIPLGEATLVSVAGRVSHQCGEICSITFEFPTAEQCKQIQNLITKFTN
jgi:PilZ domain